MTDRQTAAPQASKQTPPSPARRLDESRLFQLSEPFKEAVDLYIGPRLIASLETGQIRVPLHAIAEQIDQLQSQTLVATSRSGHIHDIINTDDFRAAYQTGDLLSRMRAGVGPGKWVNYRYGRSGGKVTAEIGLVLPHDVDPHSQITVSCNGIAGQLVANCYDRHMGQTHWFLPASHVQRRLYEFDVPELSDWVVFTLTIAGLDPSRQSAFRPAWNFTDRKMLDDLPDDARIHRVSSVNANRASFLNGGKSSFEALCDIGRRHGLDVDTSPITALDWGVGCGRVARHFTQLSNVDLVGIDIDFDNVDWCVANLPGKYRVVDLNPPVDLPDASFNLIYACSVLSHLSERDVDLWLQEIERLLHPDGLALLSFHGTSNAMSYLSSRPQELSSLLQDQLFDSDMNDELSGFIPDSSYYRQVFGSDTWWNRKFSETFDLVTVEPAVLSGFQNIAVLRRKRPAAGAE